MKVASDFAFERAAALINAEPAAVRAIFEVEASGRFFNDDGSIPRRFEPHHFPRKHWGALGFNPGKLAPWRASLKLRTSVRGAMYDRAKEIDPETARRASSWGAPQIMGFNFSDAGYSSATEMVEAFHDPAQQVAGFVRLVTAWGLDSAIRAKDWHAFALRYNGPGKVADYAAKMESAYRRATGGKASPVVIRIGARGAAVQKLQVALDSLGFEVAIDGSFGPATKAAVEAFQTSAGLRVDGVVGAMTWEAIERARSMTRAAPEGAPVGVPTKESSADRTETMISRILAAVFAGGGGATAIADLDPKIIAIVGGLVVVVILALIIRETVRREGRA